MAMSYELFDFVQSLQLISTNSTYGQAVLEACASLNPEDTFSNQMRKDTATLKAKAL